MNAEIIAALLLTSEGSNLGCRLGLENQNERAARIGEKKNTAEGPNVAR